ncbi:MAG: hypothetical protein M1822_005546 [Bathelium mastoideum]|nr:MAG: hypothetical protein M1822_005546 [Bathelium mastoideum]
MTAALLESDHVNYLIWRYLQESGPRFRKAADQLRRDWEVEPEELPFARSVRPGDLVRLVLDGLHHDEIATGVLQAQLRSSEEAAKRLDITLTERKYQFIFQPSLRNLSIRSAPHLTKPFEDRERGESPLKRPRDGINGAPPDSMGKPAAKRARKSAAVELKERHGGGATNGILHTDDESTMRPDEDETMIDDGPVQPVSTLEHGISNEAQTEPDGFILPVEPAAIEHEVAGLDSAVMHTSWSPNRTEDWLYIASDHVANLCHLPTQDAPGRVDTTRLDISSHRPYTITSQVWDYRGEVLLLSYVHDDRSGPFSLVSFNRGADKVELENLDQNASSCLALRQNPVTHMIMAFSCSASDHDRVSGSGGSTQIWYPDFWVNNSPTGMTDHSEVVHDGDWIDHSFVAISCGHNVELYMCVPGGWDKGEQPSVAEISSASSLEMRRIRSSLLEPACTWDIVRHVPRTHRIICVSTESAVVAWADVRTNETQSLAWDKGKDGQINGLGMETARTVVTSLSGVQHSNSGSLSDDMLSRHNAFAIFTDTGKIFVYDLASFTIPAKETEDWSPAMVRQYDIGPFPALVASFSHNRRLLAVGSLEKVYIYDLRLDGQRGREAVAIWTGESRAWANGHGDDRNGFHSDGKEEELNEVCLSWNGDDTRLVYASDRRIVTIIVPDNLSNAVSRMR